MSENPSNPADPSLSVPEPGSGAPLADSRADDAPPLDAATEQTTTPEPPQEHAPMLDVHAPHETIHTWKDFFLHIATIVIGLLIAVGLEQTVEYFHHRGLAADAREQLRLERHLDERSNELNIFTTLRHESDLKHDLAFLHAAKTRKPLPSQPLILRRFRFIYPEDTWLRLHQSGIIQYLDPKEMAGIAYRYFNQDGFASRVTESIEDLGHAESVFRSENDPPQTSVEESIIEGHFLDNLVDGHFTMSEAAIQRGYAPLIEHADLPQLTLAEIDELEHSIKIALADDDAELNYCFNVKRYLQNHPEYEVR